MDKELATGAFYSLPMNANYPVSIPANRGLAIRCDGASIWRGRFIEEFALAETAVSEALAFFATVPGRGSQIKLPHLVGRRFEVLKSIVGTHGPFAIEGQRVAKALEEWSDLHQLRALLCHGSSTVTIDQNQRWHMTLRLLNFRAGEIERDVMEVAEHEAAAGLDLLCSARLRLEGQLQGMLAAFSR